MSQANSFQPNWASMPGDTIADILKSRELSLDDFAKLMDSNLDNVQKLLHGSILINDEIAMNLQKALGSTVDFWINRERQYREGINRLKDQEESKWLNELPIKDMFRLGYINKSKNLIGECLSFFNVPDVWTWRRKYNEVVGLTAFRKSTSFESNSASVAAWLRQGEIVSEANPVKEWDSSLFTSKLPEMRQLIKLKSPKVFISKLKEICAECGVSLVIARTPSGCPASGATKFISPTKAMILLSFRYLTEDQFWFTFFHEVAHLILHGHKSIFIEEDGVVSKEEEEANAFSENILIPKRFHERLRTMRPSQLEIKKLAIDADISLGIIVGQLQFLKRLNPGYLNGFKRKFDLADIMDTSH